MIEKKEISFINFAGSFLEKLLQNKLFAQ